MSLINERTSGRNSVVAIHQTSKPHEIAKRLNSQYRAIERSSDEMGRDLVLLKNTKPPGIEWGIYLKELGIEFSREYADRLIRRVEPKKPIEPKPAPEPSSDPDVEIIDENPERVIGQKALLDQGRQLLKKMTRETRSKFFDYQEKKYFACFEEESDRWRDEVERLNDEISKLRQKLDPGICTFEKNDGGRADAGHEGSAGDCGARAVSIATGKPYNEVYEGLKAAHAKYVKRYPDSWEARINRRKEPIEYGCSCEVMRTYMRSIGWRYTDPKGPLYLRADSLPKGRLVVLINRHCVAVIDGTIHDTYDSGGAGKRPVEGYWTKAPEATAAMPTQCGGSDPVQSTPAATPTIEERAAALAAKGVQEPIPDFLRRKLTEVVS